VARGDEWVRRYLVILRAVFWFHPMVRYCCDQVQLFAEKACDDHVLRIGHKPSEYSDLLLKLGQKQSGIETAFVISGMAQSQITSRIKSILESNTSRRPMTRRGAVVVAVGMLIATSAVFALRPSASANNMGPTGQSHPESGSSGIPRLKVGLKDWPQWGGSSARNNSTTGQKIPFDWDLKTGKNIRWSMPVGSDAYGGVVVANGKVFAGANNFSGYIKRFPKNVDLGVLLCFNEADGRFLWQHSNAKLPAGRVNDWPSMGICSAPLVDGERLWYVTNRGEVVCLDIEGFWDGENDGPFKQEDLADKKNGADVVWVFDMMKQLGVSQHNMANCSVTCAGDRLFVNTSNGVDEGHVNLSSESAPSFICLNRETGGVLWTDNSPGKNVLHGQWSSPAYAVLGDVPQAIFGGGDGFLYGFLAQGENGNSKLLWKFDCNPKDTRYELGGRATRNHIIATPVIYDGLVYVAVGEDPEHGEGNGHLWCINPTKRGDVSPTLVFNAKSPDKPIPHKRIQALVASEGDFEKPNPNSAAVWHYVGSDPKIFEQTMHRTLSTVAIKNDLLFVPDFSGVFHCVDAKTGKPHWTYDLIAACWASPLIVDDRVYISDEEGQVAVFKLSSTMELIQELELGSAIYTTPIVANDTLFMTTRNRLWAFQEGTKSEPVNDY
jgi:outer membrane protein assembly factor BamB